MLDDEQKTAVISKSGLGSALGMPNRSNSLPRFLSGKSIARYVNAEILEKLEKPLIFQWLSGDAQPVPVETHGYDVTMLIDVCKTIIVLESEGKLLPGQAHIAKQAHIIMAASAKAGITGLVYALSGYDATRQEVVAAFKFFVRAEAREYEKEFPDQLYEEWYRIYELPKPERNKPWKFKHLTVDQVYKPLAKSSGKILELTKAQRAKSEERSKKLHQFLSDIGVKALRTQLGQLLGIARISKSKDEYEGHFETLFGDKLDQMNLFPEKD